MKYQHLESALRTEFDKRARSLEPSRDGLVRLQQAYANAANDSMDPTLEFDDDRIAQPKRRWRAPALVATCLLLVLGSIEWLRGGGPADPASRVESADIPYCLSGSGLQVQLDSCDGSREGLNADQARPIRPISVDKGLGIMAPLFVGRDVNTGQLVAVGGGAKEAPTMLVVVSASNTESLSLLRDLGALWDQDPPLARVVVVVTGQDEQRDDSTEIERVVEVARSLDLPIETIFDAGYLVQARYQVTFDESRLNPSGLPRTHWVLLDGTGTIQRRMEDNSPTVDQVRTWLKEASKLPTGTD